MRSRVVQRSDVSAWAGDLTRPAPVLAALTLGVNDHLLKGAGLVPAPITGKLSDASGLFLAGVVAVCLARGVAAMRGVVLPRRDGRAATLALAAVAIAFTALKLWPAGNHAVAAVWGVNVLDASDLWCLPAVAVAGVWLRDRELVRGPGRPPRFATVLALVGALLVCAATPRAPPVPPPPVPGWIAAGPPLTAPCGELTAWFSKSGKTGAGVTIAVTAATADAACPVTVTAARLRFPDAVVAGREIALTGPVTTDSADRAASELHYLAFEFDNQARWNRGARTATLELELTVAGEPRAWTLPAHHAYLEFPLVSQ